MSLSRQKRQQVQIKGGKGADRATASTNAHSAATATKAPPKSAASTRKAAAATPAAAARKTPATTTTASKPSAPKEEVKPSKQSPKADISGEDEEEEDNTVYEKFEVVTLDTSRISDRQKNHPLAQLLGPKVARFDEKNNQVVEVSTAEALNGRHVAVCFYLKSYDKAELGRILKTIKESQASKGNKFEVRGMNAVVMVLLVIMVVDYDKEMTYLYQVLTPNNTYTKPSPPPHPPPLISGGIGGSDPLC